MKTVHWGFGREYSSSLRDCSWCLPLPLDSYQWWVWSHLSYSHFCTISSIPFCLPQECLLPGFSSTLVIRPPRRGMGSNNIIEGPPLSPFPTPFPHHHHLPSPLSPPPSPRAIPRHQTKLSISLSLTGQCVESDQFSADRTEGHICLLPLPPSHLHHTGE